MTKPLEKSWGFFVSVIWVAAIKSRYRPEFQAVGKDYLDIVSRLTIMVLINLVLKILFQANTILNCY
jgi:hypothetical protein